MTKEYRITTRVFDLNPGDRILINGEAKTVADVQSIEAHRWFILFDDGSEAIRDGWDIVQLLEMA